MEEKTKEKAIRDFFTKFDSTPIDTIDDVYKIGDHLIENYKGDNKDIYTKVINEAMRSSFDMLEKEEKNSFYR